MTSLLKLEHISMCFDGKKSLLGERKEVQALSDVNLEIKPGEIVALVGESGCGKTTLGKVITGLHRPSKGRMYFEGKDISGMNASELKRYRSSVQLVQQDSYAALNPARTIYHSLSAPILHHNKVKGSKAAKAKVRELLETVGLAPADLYLDKYPHQLSGGQRQRVLLARAISLEPKIIVADEPVSMVDVSMRLSILNLMAELNRNMGIAFVYITHDLATAKYIAQSGKMAVVYLGRIVEFGKVKELLSEPKHPYLQALLTAVPVPDPVVAKRLKVLPLRSFEMPNVEDPPHGCGFHPRCPYANVRCETHLPALDDYAGVSVACHHVKDVPVWSLNS
ncbi:ABC transporter ATP-binding protein [Paenibacillus gansuensis]|uniref:ABC transporter ATP-binding protein n=1 Tax=Paenibacillus gansuensis TaxID=306542 RepID=A0ABW5PB94_9BACL